MQKLREKERTSQKMRVNISNKVNYGLNVFKDQANVKGYILPVNVKNYQSIIERKILNLRRMAIPSSA